MPRRTKARGSAPASHAAFAWTRAGGRLVRAPAAAPAAPAPVSCTTVPLLELCLALLPPLEIIRAQLVCRAWRGAARSCTVWSVADLSLRSTFKAKDRMVRAAACPAVRLSRRTLMRRPAHRPQRELVPKLAAFATAHGAPCRYFKLQNFGEADDADTGGASGSAEPPQPSVASAAPTLQVLRVADWQSSSDKAAQAPSVLEMFQTVVFPALRALTLSGVVRPVLTAAVLRAAPALRYLCLDSCTLEKEATEALLAAPGLREAHLRVVTVHTAGEADPWEDHEGNGALDVASDTLQSLYVDSCKVRFGLGTPHLPALRTLTLAGVIARGAEVNDASLLRFTASSPQLTRLVVIGCARGRQAITSAVLAPLAAQCPALEELYLCRNDDTPRFLFGDNVLDSPLTAPVFAFPRLRVLSAYLTDRLGALRCPMLQELHLQRTSARGGNNYCLESQLSAAATLRVLDVSAHCLTAVQLARLADALPALQRLTARRNFLSLDEADALERRIAPNGLPGASNLGFRSTYARVH